jgi:antitoxin component YwqK of YwqJK toxin-antitoxin module
MKNLLGVLLLSLLPCPAINAQTKTDLEIEGLKGPVKSIRFERAEFLQGASNPVEKWRFLESVTTYDEKGNRVEESRYNSDGSLFEKMVFTRDDKGNQTKTIFKANGTVDSKWVYAYDSHGRITNGAWYNSDGSLRLKIVKTYDVNGKLIEDAMYNADGSTRYKTLFSYDAEGNRRDTAYSNTGSLANKSVWSKSGSNVVLYNNDGTISYEADSQSPTLEYDSHGNWIKWSTPKRVTRGNKTEEVIEVVYRSYIYY